MTRKLAPGTPELILPDGTKSGPDISDSSWEGLDDPEENTQKNLTRIAKARKKDNAASIRPEQA